MDETAEGSGDSTESSGEEKGLTVEAFIEALEGAEATQKEKHHNED